MKKSAASVFGKVFSKVLLGILIVVLVGICAYQGVMHVTDYKINKNLKNGKENGGEDSDIQAADREKLISVLYTKDSGSKEFGDAFLRMFNKESKEYQYVLIPAELSVTLDDITYQQLQTESDGIPKTIVLKDIPDYFTDSEEEYKAANRILKATFGLTHIDLYESATLESLVSVINLIDPIKVEIPKKMIFKNQDGINEVLRKGEQTLIGNQVVGMLRYTKGYEDPVEDRMKLAEQYWRAYFKAVADLDKKGIEHYYEEYYKYVESADNHDVMQPYLKDMSKSNSDLVKVSLLPGASDKSVYNMDKTNVAQFMQAFISGQAVDLEEQQETTEQTTTTDIVTPTTVPDYSITVVNAALVEGTAGKWQEILTTAGFNVVGVDTATEQQGDTVIYVNQEGIGQELKEYFPDAAIEVGYTGDTAVRIMVGLNYS